jgi:DNA polymerase-3 subunit gamma/tau
VRDSLSLLDQATAYSEGNITAAKVQDMLGFADKSQVINIFRLLAEGRIAEVLDAFTAVAATSAEPAQLFTDLLEFCHLITRVKITPDLKPAHVSEQELEAAQALSGSLILPILSRMWQMLLKAQGEIKYSSNPKQTAEMALIRIAYSTELPDPNDLIRDLKKNLNSTRPEASAPRPAPMQQQSPQFAPVNSASPTSFAEVAELFRKKGEYIIHNSIVNEIHLVNFKPERLEIRLASSAPKELPNKIGNLLNSWTGARWVVVISSEAGQPTIAEQLAAGKLAAIEAAKNDELVSEVLKYFPEAEIKDVIYKEQKKENSI